MTTRFWGLALLALSACGGGESGERQGCDPGSIAACVCADGAEGGKTCKSTGSGYGDCDCRPVSGQDIVGGEDGADGSGADGAEPDGAQEVVCVPACAGKACARGKRPDQAYP